MDSSEEHSHAHTRCEGERGSKEQCSKQAINPSINLSLGNGRNRWITVDSLLIEWHLLNGDGGSRQ